LLSFYTLKELTLHKNSIKVLPWDIHRLRALRKLDVSSNDLQYLPHSIYKMPLLEDFIPVPNPSLIYEDELTNILINSSSEGPNSAAILREFLSKKEVPAVYRGAKESEEKQLAEDQSKLTADGRLLWKLLRDREGFSSLRAYMQKEHNHENLLFWREVRKFTQRYYSDREIRCQALINDAMQIFKDYIAEDSKYTINISATVTSKLRSVFTDPFHFPSGINQWVFAEAYEQSFALMERDMFRRFKTNDESRDIVKKLEDASAEKIDIQVW